MMLISSLTFSTSAFVVKLLDSKIPVFEVSLKWHIQISLMARRTVSKLPACSCKTLYMALSEDWTTGEHRLCSFSNQRDSMQYTIMSPGMSEGDG